MIGALADALHRVPMAVGRADGWGADDTAVTAAVWLTMLLTVAFLARWAPRLRGRGNAHWHFWGRRPQPFIMGLAGVSLWMGGFLVRGATSGAFLQGPLGVALGLAAILGAVLLLLGWWSERHTEWMTHGMLLAGGMWAALAGANFAVGSWVSGGVAFWIAFMALLSWWAEVTDTGPAVGAVPGPP